MSRATLVISSEKFARGGLIPARYTCHGMNINPPLDIENLPIKAKSLVVMLKDRSVDDKDSMLWLLYNIPVKNRINEDEKKGELGLNSFNKFSYVGPCSESEAHRYMFKVYALDDFLVFNERNVDKCDVEAGIMYHLVGYGELDAIYGRKVKWEMAELSLLQIKR
ncbi:YbhB/YbcL family Raf kinase inhibitor-like protein [Algoriphagus sp. D3-2-R+10]|uniref:YbhB/YbcL family Raf kinase inhibitor-like protein n=1 Tax=Algoriphagus aurantiacus TaxID=3103948 RepID=UPI002B37BD0C|nr:YbhB/YbcL family Raf kinase inhibitor-like protein [Algoriphagus sp. D3-2-R+10]MEB2777427.1 YbhB/YbcL family Raf kinase inhibitor-like protein [Algoriphagus sp. D3-2-R+10]